MQKRLLTFHKKIDLIPEFQKARNTIAVRPDASFSKNMVQFGADQLYAAIVRRSVQIQSVL
jgi:hypothetical protein